MVRAHGGALGSVQVFWTVVPCLQSAVLEGVSSKVASVECTVVGGGGEVGARGAAAG